VSGLVEAKPDGDVMGIHVHYSGVRYAVIQASSIKDRPERLIIAYQDEDRLRDLIAAPSIFGVGFASREEAKANLESFASPAICRSRDLHPSLLTTGLTKMHSQQNGAQQQP